MVRYADDFIILTTSEAEAAQALAIVRGWMENHQLELHPEKTRIVNETDDPNGFDFLGYNFKKGMRLVRKKSLTAMRDKIRLHTRRSQGIGITTVINKLNPILRGWFNYFKHVKKNELKTMDGFVRRRLRSILRKYHKKGKGTGCNINDHKQWTNASTRAWDFSQWLKSMRKRANPDEETINWRAVCGRTARFGGRGESGKALLYPYRNNPTTAVVLACVSG
jgi:RNA-directed DNA polymerase